MSGHPADFTSLRSGFLLTNSLIVLLLKGCAIKKAVAPNANGEKQEKPCVKAVTLVDV